MIFGSEYVDWLELDGHLVSFWFEMMASCTVLMIGPTFRIMAGSKLLPNTSLSDESGSMFLIDVPLSE